jgi:hypothetical protein
LAAAGITLLALQHDEVPASLAGSLIGAGNIMSALAGYIFGQANRPDPPIAHT